MSQVLHYGQLIAKGEANEFFDVELLGSSPQGFYLSAPILGELEFGHGMRCLCLAKKQHQSCTNYSIQP